MVRIRVPVPVSQQCEDKHLEEERKLYSFIALFFYSLKLNFPGSGQLNMSKFGSYIQEAYDELVHKVSWPSWDELQQTTIIVLVSLIIITLVIFGMDVAIDAILKTVYNLLGK